jgi:predicted dehydrogenase
MTNWGIIGPGRIARKFADDLRLVPDARLLGVASTSMERAQAFAAAYEVPHVFDSYDDLVRLPDLDVVYIATAHTQHVDCALRCIRAGKAVLVEKPCATNAEDAQKMFDLAQEMGVFVMEGIWSFFIPGFAKTLDLVREGAIGRVHTVRADFGFLAPFDPEWRLFNKALAGGSLLDIGIYPALLMLSVLGAPQPEDIDAVAVWTPTGVDATAVFNLRYPDGRLGMGYSTIMATTPTEAHLYGDLGQIQMHTRFHHPQQLTVSRYDGRDLKQDAPIVLPYEGWGYHFEAQHVMDCLSQNLRESPVIPHQFSLDLVRTLDAIRAKMGLEY